MSGQGLEPLAPALRCLPPSMVGQLARSRSWRFPIRLGFRDTVGSHHFGPGLRVDSHQSVRAHEPHAPQRCGAARIPSPQPLTDQIELLPLVDEAYSVHLPALAAALDSNTSALLERASFAAQVRAISTSGEAAAASGLQTISRPAASQNRYHRREGREPVLEGRRPFVDMPIEPPSFRSCSTHSAWRPVP